MVFSCRELLFSTLFSCEQPQATESLEKCSFILFGGRLTRRPHEGCYFWSGVGHVNVPCKKHTCCNATQLKGWGGVGHVNVPCNLHTCWMLRNWRVGVGWGMLTFLVICTHVVMLRNWRVGVGWGMLTFLVICTHVVCNATQLKGWGGVGHVNVPCNLHTCWMLRNWRVGVGWGMLTFLVGNAEKN